MSLNTFWRNRLPLVKIETLSPFETFHAYIVLHEVLNDEMELVDVTATPYGVLKLCENINIRRAPIPNQCVLKIQIRQPYEHCAKCENDIAWQKRMNFGRVEVI